MTRDEQIAKHFPDHISRIRKLANPNWLADDVGMTSPKNTLAEAFDWAESDEGRQYWNEIYEKA